MGKDVFLVSDLHFGHSKMYERPFLRPDGSRLRPWTSAAEADEAMIQNWNSTVSPGDKVYVLGDVAMSRPGLETVARLNGDKVLIAGNHDAKWEKDLYKYFRSVRSYWKLDNFVLNHVPVHPDSLDGFNGNIHGHLHCHVVRLSDGSPDPRYQNVSVEQTDYRPISFWEVKRRFAGLQD